MLTALLLGAGASRELGMPLRDELNAEIVAWLTPTSLRKINTTWRARGYGHPDQIIDDLTRILESSEFDYESLLGQWEAQYIADAGNARGLSYHTLYAWLAQVVSLALYRRQVSNRDSFRDGLPFFAGLVPLVRDNAPLWVFSLNHDVLVECIAAHFGVPVNCGFPSHTIALPCRKGPGTIIARLQADMLSEAEQADAALPFFPPGTPGINLLKIHGALDIFAFGDSHDLLKLKPEAHSFDAIIDALQIANEGLLDPGLSPDPLSVPNQIPFIAQRRAPRGSLSATPAATFPGVLPRQPGPSGPVDCHRLRHGRCRGQRYRPGLASLLAPSPPGDRDSARSGSPCLSAAALRPDHPDALLHDDLF